MANSWKKNLETLLIKRFGAKKGGLFYNKYASSFPPSYIDECSEEVATTDIQQLEKLNNDHRMEIELYENDADKEFPLHIRLFQYGNPIPLSDILPMLENMDLRTYYEHPYKISLDAAKYWISDFSVSHPNKHINIQGVKDNFEDALIATYLGQNENDGFNKLVLDAQLSSREVAIIRAYAKYLHQTGFHFTRAYVEKAVIAHSNITKNLITLFKVMHNPNTKGREKIIVNINQEIQQALDAITSLDEDRIMRRLWLTMKATLRTNYFQHINGKPKAYLSIKLDSKKIPELPLPLPLYEIFVYSPRFEAIHLRSEKVSRGGIRWSDRLEDFRTEILGLMKAQKVKNSVIVPSGAKGGFVLKAVPPNATRDMIGKEVISCYTAFISGLLDITDNIKNNKIIRPLNVVCYDDEDPYLVVAADKGTASFSDTANSISKAYDFWLGDAFASGGSEGYDHKKMGITARGAWESVKRLFRELDVNIAKTTFTVVGIGDMSGDVFGNGMLYTKNIKLVAAFDHRNIFLDPTPNPEKSFDERSRLFKLPMSSWEDFNSKIISKGGGVYKRSLKSITITPEVKAVLGIQENTMTPNELIRAILRAPVDLLFNGGIGTYVKASSETHADVGDKTNEFCRVNGIDLRCRLVGEGGNLGFTQLGRIEYALKGGLINTDFIDNSAGVDCSDHEVNIKILLNKEVANKNISEKQRNQLLVKMTNEVAKLVLRDNYNQALVLSFSSLHSIPYTNLYENFIKYLESSKSIDRAVEFLPTDKSISERQAQGLGFTRPELAVLLAYAKIHIKNELLKSDVPEEPFFTQVIQTAFPALLWKEYQAQLEKHSLRREIIATQLSNLTINSMGITFAYRLQTETGASIAEIVRAHAVASVVYRVHEFSELIDSLDFKVPVSVQYDLFHHIRRLLNLATRWFLRNNRLSGDISKIVNHYAAGIKKLEPIVPTLMSGATKDYLHSLTQQFVQSGLKEIDAEAIAVSRAMYTALNIIEVATIHKFDLVKTAHVYFMIGEKFNLVWMRDQIANDSREGHWNTLARLSLRDELDSLQRQLTVAALKDNKKEPNIAKLIDGWRSNHEHAIKRWENILHMLYASTNIDYVMFFIALRELADLIVGSTVTA